MRDSRGGGYSGLNPVYAAGDYGDYTVKYDATHNSLDYVTQNSAGGYNTYGIYKIKLNNIVLDSSIGASPMITVGNYFSIDGSNGSISAANGKFEVSGTGAITASSLKLTGTNAVEDVGEAINTNTNNIAINTTNIQSLDGKIDTVNTNIRSDMAAELGKLDAKKVDTSAFGAYTASNDAAVNELKNKTQNIRVDTDTMVTFSDATYIDGITHAGGVRLADNGVRAEELVLEEGSAQATLTREGLAALNSMVYDANDKINNDTDGKPIIQAGNGSVVGGVTLDSGNITGVQNATVGGTLKVDNIKSLDGHNEITVADMATTKYNTDKISYDANDGTTIAGDVMVNKGAPNQVKINSEGIVVGLTSAAINGDGFYVGGHNYNDAKAALDGKDGKIKGAGGKFGVDDQGNVTTTGDIKGQDITASGNLTVDGDVEVKKDLKVTGNITGADITASGALKGKTLGIGTNGTEFTVDADGAVKAAGGKVEIDKTGKATFGDTANNRTTIAGKLATFGENTSTDYTTINGGKIDTYDLTVRNDMTVKNFKADNITSTNRITVGAAANEVYLDANGTLSLGVDANQKLGKTQLANINDTIKTGKVIDANSATIGGVEIIGGNVTTATGTIQGNTISDGAGAKLNGGKITANEGKIGNVEITTAGAVSGVTSLTVNGEIKANVFKVDDDNYLNNSGITAKGGKIGAAVVDATTLTVGGTKLDNAAGITTNKLAIGGMTLTGTSLDTGTADFQVNGVTFNQGEVAARADKGFVAGTSSFKQGSLIVDAKNKLEVTNGLTTEKATVNGTLDVSGKATFGTAGSQTAIDGNTITTDTLKANKLILGASGATTVEVDKDGSLKAANGKFEVDKDGALKAANGAFNVDKDGKTTFTKDANNLSSINGGNIWAKATDIADNTSSELAHDYKGLHIKGNKSGQKSAFDFDTASGIGTFTGQDNSTTKINGSAIRSEKSDGTAGKLDGENLTLYKDANNQTTMSAGKVTFKSAKAGQYGGTETTIDGGVITTDTLNVQRINLGKEMVNGDGTTTTVSNLSIDEYGNIKAAGGKFTVAGTNQTNPGALHNEVGKTSFDTTETGASMKFDNTAATDGVKSEVSVGANQVTMSAGNQTVTTTKDGTVFENSDHNTPFGGGSETKTTINGNEITTGKITTDQLVIKGNGSGDADGTGNGSIALGGDGSIKSNIKDTTTGIESTFETKADKIGSVITGGTVELRQELDANTGKITNKAGDMSTELDNNGFTVKQNGKTDVKIADGDVTVTNDKNTATPGQEVHLSDLGSLNNLDGELEARDEYQNNKTAVGAINAEAAIRREEVARLDNRIDDVNNRVDKVGAMAAAIASLKSIGYDPQAPSEFSIGLGQYKGETGVAMGFFHYPNKNFMINVSLSTAGGETMGGIGATWRFGHKSPQKLLDEQREAQAKKELAAAEKYQAAAKLAKEAQERAEYAAKLARQAQVSADNAKAAADATQAKHFQ